MSAFGGKAVGLDWQVGGFAADPPGRLQRGLNLSACAGGRFRRWRQRSGELECCCGRYRCWATFPRSNGFDYDFDSGQCALDFTLHALNLSVQKSCSSWSSDVSPCSPSIELEVKRSSDDLI